MTKFLSVLLLSLPLLFGCGEEKVETIEAKTVQLMRVVCDPIDEPVSLISSRGESIVIEGVYKIGPGYKFHHVNGRIYEVPDNYDCKAQMIDRFACVSKEEDEFIYDGPCRFSK